MGSSCCGCKLTGRDLIAGVSAMPRDVVLDVDILLVGAVCVLVGGVYVLAEEEEEVKSGVGGPFFM